MRKRLRKSIAGILALLMVVGSFQLNGLQVKAEGETEEVVFAANELDARVDWSGATFAKEDGKIAIDFTTNNDELKLILPETIDMSLCEEITVKVEDQTVPIAIKVWSVDGKEEDHAYELKDSTEYTIKPTTSVSTNLLGIMSQGDAAGTVSIISVTLKMKPDSGNQPGETTPNEGEVVFAANELDARVDWSGATFAKEDGKIAIDFTTNNDELKLILPETIDMSLCEEITVKVEDQTVPIAIKVWSVDGKEEDHAYELKDSTEYTIKPTTSVSTNLLGIMSQGDAAGTVSIISVTLKMKPDSGNQPGETTPNEGEVVFAANELDARVDWSGATFAKEDGKIAIDFTTNNDELKLILPETIDMSLCEEITVKVEDQTVPIAIKVWSVDGKEEDHAYELKDSTEYTIKPTTSVSTNLLGIMSQGDVAGTVSIISVTLKMNPDDGNNSGDSGNTGNTPGDGDNGGTQPETTTEVTYNFKDLENVNFYGVLLNVGKGGELSADYEKQYQETFYKLPDNIDSTKVKKVELVLSSGNSLCLKLYTNADGTGNSEFANDYGPVVVPTKEFSSFGIMNMVDGTNSVKVSGVKFTIADSVENVEIKKTYTFNDLTADKNGGVGATVDSATGAVTYAYTNHYQEIFYAIPKEIDMSKVHKVTFNVSSNNADTLAYKFYTEETYGGDWPNAAESQLTYGNPNVVLQDGFSGIKYFGIMSQNAEEYSAVVDSVTFHTTGWGYSEVVKEPTVAGDKVFLADDVSVSWGSANYDEQVEGKIDVQFKKEGQGYPEVRIYLGEELNMADCTSVKFVVADQTAPVAFKLWQGASEKKVWYGNSGKQEYVFTPGIADSIDSIGIMYADTAENVPEDASISFISVTFTMKEGSSSAEDEYYETDDTQGDNLITNPNFADADLSMWGVAQDGSTITTGVSETPIFADVKTYGIISDRTSNYQAFAQDLTGKVQNNKEYSFSFFAKLSDDYADAPSSQRQITFGPYEVTDGNANYNIQVSGSPKTLTAGKWTKITGTFKMASLGDPDQVVVRLLEQGENYGSGPGVKGEYYITGVSVKEIVKEKVEIEKDIPDWQSAIVKDLGAGTIAGTAVTYNEMADEALWELVTKHFNAVTFGNELKLDAMIGGAKGATEHITFNGKDLEVPVLKLDEKQATKMLDKILEWNTANPDKKLKVRGHVLVWHSQAPAWFFKENYDANADYVSKDVMDLRLEWYIKTILEYYTGANSKYKDLFYGWDVVNEAINDSTATYRGADESSWAAVYGDKSNEYIIKAFQWANKYAPASLELYYNDYNDCVPSKVAGIVELLKAVKAAEGTRIDGMGMQAHHNIDSPSVEQVEAAVRAYCAVVGKVQWTELDIKASSAYDGTDATRAAEWNKMAHRYKAYYDVLKKLDAEEGIEVSGIIFWGVVDKYSWLQSSNSVGGASNGGNQCPLLFDDNYKAKPAFWAFVDPDRLTPDVKNIIIAQKVDDTYPSGVEYSMEKGATKATVIPMWDTTGLKVLVKVQDATVDATDAVTVYVDPAMTGGATTPVKATVKRADAKAVSGGYEAEVAVALSSVGALKEVSMDVVVVNGTEKVAFNDTTFAQESSSKYYANALMKVGTTVQNGTIVVDGVVDAEWAEADVIPLAIGSVKAKPTFKILWDKEYLYVLAEVQDSVLNKDNKDAWMQDSIEVFIDENNKKSSGYDGDDKQYRINYANEQSFNGQKCIAENVKSAAKVVDGGYVIEAAFKWTDIKPANGTNVGLELQLNDAESGSVRNNINWADDTNKGFESSRVFGTITLVGDPTLPELVEDLEVLVDKNATKEEKIEAVKDVIAKVQEVVEAGNTEELTNELVAEIEDLFAEAIGRVLEIVNKDNKVPQIKKVIGAIIGINLEDEAKMVFEAVTAPALDAKYKNAFAFDAKLFAGNKAIQPLVPVTIRMEVPSSIDKNGKIAVLHYKDGATTPEKLAAKIVDGLLEFTTSSFSTFVVVNEVEEQSSDSNIGSDSSGSADSNTGSNTGSNSGSSAPAATPAPSTDTGVKAPATGDSAYPIAVVAILLLTGSAAVIMAGKRKKEEE